MGYILTIVAIILTVAMIIFTCFYAYLVIRFYQKICEDKTVLDEYIRQQYDLHTKGYKKEVEDDD